MDENNLPGLGDLFAMGMMRPTPGPGGGATDIIQPMGLLGPMLAQYVEPRGTESYRTVTADVGKLDTSLARDPDMYVGAQGAGGIRNRYANFGEFMQKGEPVEMPMASIGPRGEAAISNGRHRFAWLRDQGATEIPVRVPEDLADEFTLKFGRR